jgi:hypothetical protein
MFREIIAVYSENHMTLIKNSLCEHNAELLNSIAGGTYNGFHCALKSKGV